MEMRRLHAAMQVAPCHPFHGASAVAQTWRGLQEAIGRILIGNLGDAGYPLAKPPSRDPPPGVTGGDSTRKAGGALQCLMLSKQLRALSAEKPVPQTYTTLMRQVDPYAMSEFRKALR